MKINLFLFVLFFYSSQALAQKKHKLKCKSGYECITKAKACLAKGNLADAQGFIDKAKKCDYGFCGNAWATAYGEIRLTQAQVFNVQHKFDESLRVLDSLSGCSIGADCGKRDSLKVVTLVLKFGKEKVKNAFAKIDKLNTTSIDDASEGRFWVLLDDLNYKFFFVEGGFKEETYGWHKEQQPVNQFYNMVKDLPFYKLLQ